METFAHEEGALVGVLCPVVVVKLAQHVGQLIQVVRSQPGVIVHRVVRRRVNGALPHTLTHEEKSYLEKILKI